MIDISDDFRQQFESGDAQKEIHITFPNSTIQPIENDRIYYESMILTEAICDSENLTLGGCIASCFEIQAADVAEDIRGAEIAVTMQIGEDILPLFHGFIDTVQIQANRRFKKIVAYDQLYTKFHVNVADWYHGAFLTTTKPEYKGSWKTDTAYLYPDVVFYDGEYYRYLEYADTKIKVTEADGEGNESFVYVTVSEQMMGKTPAEIMEDADLSPYINLLESYSIYEYGNMTMKEFRDSFFENLGITQASVSLPNDNMVIEKTLDTTELAAIDVAKAICEMNGCFGKINRDNIFDYVFLASAVTDLYPEDTCYPSDTLYPGLRTIQHESYLIPYYRELRYEEYTVQPISAVKISCQDTDTGVIAGTGNNVYSIIGNFLSYGKTDLDLLNAAYNIAAVLFDVSYRTSTITVDGFPFLECGDHVAVYDGENTVNTIIFRRTMTGLQGLRDVYEQSGDEYQPEISNDVSRKIDRINGEISVIQSNISNSEALNANLFGFYSTKEKQTDGSVIAYTHDMPNLEDSKTIFRHSSAGFHVSRDGGGTWTEGFDNNGNAVLNILSAVGVNAQWIKLGGSGTDGEMILYDAQDNPNILFTANGIELSNGAEIIGTRGLLSVFQFDSGTDWKNIGYDYNPVTEEVWRTGIELRFRIPDHFIVTGAKIRIAHAYNHYLDTSEAVDFWGYARNINLYAGNAGSYYRTNVFSSETVEHIDDQDQVLIPEAFGASGFTPSVPSSANTTVKYAESIDIAASIQQGYNYLILKSMNDPPEYIGDLLNGGDTNILSQTGLAMATLDITGYMEG